MEQASYTENGHTYTNKTTWVYGLLDSRTDKIRYVGASVNPAQRYRAHCNLTETRYSTVNFTASAKAEWIFELREQGLRPKLVILEEVTGYCETTGKRHPAVAEAEDRWMIKLVREGHSLTNSKLPAELETDDDIFREAVERGRYLFHNGC